MKSIDSAPVSECINRLLPQAERLQLQRRGGGL